MITVTHMMNGKNLPGTTFSDALSALSHLVQPIIDFGGKVTMVTPDTLEIETTANGRVEVTQFQGPTDLMAPLAKFGRLHQENEPTQIAVLKACGYPAIKVHVDLATSRRPVDIIAAAQLAENGHQFRELMRAA